MKEEKRSQLAEKLAAEISPVIANAISCGELTFVGLTVVVDNKYSTTFPFHAVSVQDEEQEGQEQTVDEEVAKATLLAAVEYARTAGILKAKAMSLLEGLFE
jgi:hypothetical protein